MRSGQSPRAAPEALRERQKFIWEVLKSVTRAARAAKGCLKGIQELPRTSQEQRRTPGESPREGHEPPKKGLREPKRIANASSRAKRCFCEKWTPVCTGARF